jgi:hypothetical protein
MKASFELRATRKLVVLVAALSSVAYAVRALSRAPVRADERQADDLHDRAPVVEPVARTTASVLTWGEPPQERTGRRGAVAFAVTTLFFAGVTVTAGAGDEPARLLEETTETVAAPTEPADAAPTSEAPPAGPVPEPAPEPSPSPEAPPAPPAEPLPPDDGDPGPASTDDVQTPSSSSARSAHASSTTPTPSAQPVRPRRKPVARPKPTAEQEAATHRGASVIWLDRTLPDPTPLARRLDRWFVYDLVRSSRAADVNWELVLGVVRARGHGGRTPVDPFQLASLAERLRDAGAARDERAAVGVVMGTQEGAEKAIALARYNRAVGTETLVRGLAARKDVLVRRLLKDRRVQIYPGGRDDLAAGRIDVRVVGLIAYLAETFDHVSVTSLFSGHRLYARRGVVSAHVYGHAVDVAALGGVSITGNQQPGGLTEEAVRAIMLLPAELQPRQIISLLGLGGASLPLADHHDHIHVGY